MGYQQRTIAEVVDDINNTIFLPAIQREFVWDKEQILNLFDSITRSYPIGSLLFWHERGDPENRIKYKFVKDYIEESVHPQELAGTHHNIQVNNKFDDLPEKITYVLDGQQRLSALYLGLQGTLTDRRAGTFRKKPKNWRRKRLYLNLLNNPDTAGNQTVSRKFDYAFKKHEPNNTIDEYWYSVGRILDVSENGLFDEKDALINEVVEDLGVDKHDIATRNIERNIDALFRAIHQKEYVTYDEVETSDEDEILDMFIRANEGGTQLSKPDMVLSLATASWSNNEPEISARDEIHKYVGELNESDFRGGGDFDVRFILTSILACTDHSLSFTFSNFNSESRLNDMKEVWVDNDYKKAVNRSIELVESFGITLSHISSPRHLIPLITYFYTRNNADVSWGSQIGRVNRKKMLYWICSGVVSKIYGSKSPQVLRAIVDEIQNTAPNPEFPLKNMVESLSRYGVELSISEEYLSERYKGNIQLKKDKILLSLVYFPQQANTTVKTHFDHIFPRSMLDAEKLTDEFDIPLEKAQQIEKKKDCLGNFQILSAEENLQKSDMGMEEWFANRTKEDENNHFIPEDKSLRKVENYLDFVDKREDLLLKKIADTAPKKLI